MSNTNKAGQVVISRITAMQAGFNKDFTAKQSLLMDGTSVGQPAILGQLGTFLQVIQGVETARQALAARVAAKKAQSAAVTKYLSQLEAALKQALGSGNPELQDFGIKPPKTRRQLTVQEKAVAAANARATKEARGILGKKQRAKITTAGTPGVAVVDPQGNIVPGLSVGPIPPGGREPVPVAAVAAGPAPTPAAAMNAQPASPADGSPPATGPTGK